MQRGPRKTGPRRRSLQGQGFEVTQAYGGNAGLEALRRHEFDICFCDFQMSGMDGCEVTRLFREWEAVNRVGKRQDIIALTAYTSAEVSVQCKDAGMQGILTKPLKMAVDLYCVITNCTVRQLAPPPANATRISAHLLQLPIKLS